MKKIKITFLLAIVLVVNPFYTQSNDCLSVESVLCLIHDSLETAIRSCPLGEKLVLTSVFSACKLLHSLRKTAVALSIKNDKISHNIVQRINEHLLDNPALVKFLEDLNKTLEPYRQLSDDEIAIILKNSALLVPVDEVCFFAEIIRIVQGIDSRTLSSKRLNALLHEVELDKSKCALQLWAKRDHLRELYAYLEYQATGLSEKIKITKKSARAQKTINTIISALGIADEYTMALKRLEPFGGSSPKKLYELFEDAFMGQTGELNIKAYALSIEKNKREEGW